MISLESMIFQSTDGEEPHDHHGEENALGGKGWVAADRADRQQVCGSTTQLTNYYKQV